MDRLNLEGEGMVFRNTSVCVGTDLNFKMHTISQIPIVK
jgi:hypothetical protein